MAVILPHSAFIHVPKTGGTWCRAVIKRLGLRYFESGPNVPNKLDRTHAPLRAAYPTICMRDWRKKDRTAARRFTFGFVRNPMTWLESRWADAIRKYGGSAAHDIDEWFKQGFSPDFSTFIDNVIRIQPDAPSIAMLGRLGYHKDGNSWEPDEHVADFIGKNESLVADFIRALTSAGEQFREQAVRMVAPQRVASRLPAYRQQINWTDKQRQAIYNANEQLCVDFGYAV
jgi:hypothetical protein